MMNGKDLVLYMKLQILVNDFNKCYELYKKVEVIDHSRTGIEFRVEFTREKIF